jgi:hypothetical protein
LGRWEQVPALETLKYPTLKYCLSTYRIERKRLTKHMLKKANRMLKPYTEILLNESLTTQQ